MRKFKSLDGEELELYGEVKEYGILENEDGLYELCDKENEESFLTVDVIQEKGKFYVDFNEPSEWAYSNVVVGRLEE